MASRHQQVAAIRDTLSYARNGVPVEELELDDLRSVLPHDVAQLTRDAALILAAKFDHDGPPEGGWGQGKRIADGIAERLVEKLDAKAEQGHTPRDEAAAVADRVRNRGGVRVTGDGRGYGGAEGAVIAFNPGPATARGANDDGRSVAWRQS